MFKFVLKVLHAPEAWLKERGREMHCYTILFLCFFWRM